MDKPEQESQFLTHFNFLNRTLPMCIDDVRVAIRSGYPALKEAKFLISSLPNHYRKKLHPDDMEHVRLDYNAKMTKIGAAMSKAKGTPCKQSLRGLQVGLSQEYARYIVACVIGSIEDLKGLDPMRAPVETGYYSLYEEDGTLKEGESSKVNDSDGKEVINIEYFIKKYKLQDEPEE